MKLRVIIPAAGKGTRLHSESSDVPKAMRICGGRPILETVLRNTDFIRPEDTYIAGLSIEKAAIEAVDW